MFKRSVVDCGFVFWLGEVVGCLGFLQSPGVRPYCLGLEDWRAPRHSLSCCFWRCGRVSRSSACSPGLRPYCLVLEDMLGTATLSVYLVFCQSYLAHCLKYVYCFAGPEALVECFGLPQPPRSRPCCLELEDCETPLHLVSSLYSASYILWSFV